MTKPELTIIIPCYNCKKTLTEAVNSCFVQNLESFEIVMVDDGSTDGTYKLMERILSEHPEHIRIFKNETNLGGGATRNRAVEESRADIIFCLDSDDLLPEGSLSKMLGYINEKQCDAVGVHKSIKFRGQNISNIIRIDEFGFVGERIPLSSLIQRPGEHLNSLYSTFMFTKNAFKKSGGYTELHGFDTQSLAWRFLSHNLQCYTCKESSYLHRQQAGRTYYVREYEDGKVNYNWFEVLIESLILFRPEIQKQILNFDFSKPDAHIFSILIDNTDVFRDDIALDVVYTESNFKKIVEGGNPIDMFWLACTHITYKKYNEALSILKSIHMEIPQSFISEKIFFCELMLQGLSVKEAYIKATSKRQYVQMGSKSPLFSRVYRKIKKEIKKRGYLSRYLLPLISFKSNVVALYKRHTEYTEYKKRIEQILKDKKIILDIHFGGLGDWVTHTNLPSLLHTQHGVEVYLSDKSLERIRNKDIYKLCFEMNPYFKGISKDTSTFTLNMFPQEKSLLNFIFDLHTPSVTETIEKQFKITGTGNPILYYKPNKLPEYGNCILVDKNYISGKKLGWMYNDYTFDTVIKELQQNTPGLSVEYIDPKKQDLFTYIDMIHSCHHFITVLSGGAAVCAAYDKPFTAILPHNISGGSVDQFIFKNSKGKYIR